MNVKCEWNPKAPSRRYSIARNVHGIQQRDRAAISFACLCVNKHTRNQLLTVVRLGLENFYIDQFSVQDVNVSL